MKNNKIIHSVEQGDTISKLIDLYTECADKIKNLEKNEELDLLPYFREFAEIFLPDSYREHFKTEKVWRELESSYKKTCGSSPFVFEKDDESNLAGKLERFKRIINKNLYNNKSVWDDISLDVLGKPHYTVFISGVVLQAQGEITDETKTARRNRPHDRLNEYPRRRFQNRRVANAMDIYNACAEELRKLEQDEAFDFLPYFRQYAEQNLPDAFRPHFHTDAQWLMLENMYSETYQSSPFVFVKDFTEGALGHQLSRFKDLIHRNLFVIGMQEPFADYSRRMGNHIPRAVLGEQNYLSFINNIIAFI